MMNLNNGIKFLSNKRLMLVVFSCAALCNVCLAGSAKTNSGSIDLAITQFLSDFVKTHQIPGLAAAVIKNDQVIHESYYGHEYRGGKGSKIDKDSVFRLYSLTKIFTTVSVFQLISEGKLSLQEKLSDHFVGLPTQWSTVKIKHLLSHSSGLPDVRNKSKELADPNISDEAFIKLLFDESMQFNTGEQWSYNQTNFLLLEQLIEKASGMTFEDFVYKNQFPHKKTNDVYFLSDPHVDQPARAQYYSYDQDAQIFKQKKEHIGERNHPLSGINITLKAFINWNQNLDSDELLKSDIKNKMWQPFKFTQTDRNFLHGWDVYKVNQHDSYGFSGGGVSGYRKFIDHNLSIVVFTTGYKYYSVQDIIIDHLAGMVEDDLKDEAVIISEKIMSDYFLTDNINDISQITDEIHKTYPNKNLQKIFKSIGYQLYFDLQRKSLAIGLFKHNVSRYPTSYDTYGSLAYLYFLTDQLQLSRQNYEIALKLNDKNSYSERMIKKIDDQLKNKL